MLARSFLQRLLSWHVRWSYPEPPVSQCIQYKQWRPLRKVKSSTCGFPDDATRRVCSVCDRRKWVSGSRTRSFSEPVPLHFSSLSSSPFSIFIFARCLFCLRFSSDGIFDFTSGSWSTGRRRGRAVVSQVANSFFVWHFVGQYNVFRS